LLQVLEIIIYNIYFVIGAIFGSASKYLIVPRVAPIQHIVLGIKSQAFWLVEIFPNDPNVVILALTENSTAANLACLLLVFDPINHPLLVATFLLRANVSRANLILSFEYKSCKTSACA
jgi:hypothetical protein